METASLVLEGVAAGFKGRTVLSGVNLASDSGEVLVFAGPNGGGKTTLLKTAAGFLKPLSGRVLIGGRDLASMSGRERAARLSFLFQGQTALWPFTVEEFVMQGRSPHRGFLAPDKNADRAAAAKAIADAGLSGYEERAVTELSGGEFQRVLIARAMAQEAPLVLMDEPINNLDPKYQFVMMDLIRAMAGNGFAVILSLHDLTLAAAYADRVALLAGGRIAALGKPGEVLREDILTGVFDIPRGYQKFVLPRGV